MWGGLKARIGETTAQWQKNRDFDTDKDGFRYVVLSDWDNQRKVYVLTLKFPRGEGYENVMRLKEEEERKLRRLKQKARRRLGRHHRSLKELCGDPCKDTGRVMVRLTNKGMWF